MKKNFLSRLLMSTLSMSLVMFMAMCSLSLLSAQTVLQNWAALNTGANPNGIAIDGMGNIYTLNFGNNIISKITYDGVVTENWATLAINSGAYGIAIDGSGNRPGNLSWAYINNEVQL